MTLTSKVKGVVIPRRVDSAMLAKLGIPGEGTVLVKMAGIGSLGPYEFRGHDSRAFILRWEAKLGGHVLRVPLSLWMQNGHRMAHDVLDHRRLEAPIVVMFEEGEVRESQEVKVDQEGAPARSRKAGKKGKAGK
jgi:hypothetical protein